MLSTPLPRLIDNQYTWELAFSDKAISSDRVSNGLLIILTSKATGADIFKVVRNARSDEATCQCGCKIKENLLGNEGQTSSLSD